MGTDTDQKYDAFGQPLGGENAADAFGFDGSGYGQDDLGGSSEELNKPGMYHFEVTDVKLELDVLDKQGKARTPLVSVHMLVLESVEGQSPAGSRYYHKIYVGDKGGGPMKEFVKKQGLKFGVRLGMLEEVGEGDVKNIVRRGTNNSKIGIDVFQQAKGRQCIGKVVHEPAEGQYKEKHVVAFNEFWQVDDPAVADVPKNKESLAMIGKVGAAGGNAGQSKPAGGQQQQQAAPPPDDLSDL